jgi:predicted amidohydrolase YtcJ
VTATLYRHGVVHSSADPFAEAVLVADGVVAWLGPDELVHQVQDGADEVVDLDGALVTPAFVDAHAQVRLAGLAPGGALDLLAVGADEVLDAVAAAQGPVVLGVGLLPGLGAPPSPERLLAASQGRPVLLLSAGLDAAAASADLQAAVGARAGDGAVDQQADPATDLLTGARLAAALAALAAAVPDAAERGLRAAAAAGVVAVHEHDTPALGTRAELAALLAATWHDDSGLPLVLGHRAELCETSDDARAILADIPGLAGVGGDLAVDGPLEAWAAALRGTYADGPDPERPRGAGELLLTAEQVANHVAAVTRARSRAVLAVHGDRGLAEALLGLRAAADVEGLPAMHAAGHRLDGLELVDATALAEMVLLGLRGVVHPASVEARRAVLAARLGPFRAGAVLPFADLAGAGVPLGLGSGWGPWRSEPWAAVRAALLHPEPEQRVSARAAFRAHTRGGWRLAGLEASGAGEIRVGAPAHLAFWRAGALAVQAPEGRLAAWSTDARAGTPLLPELGPEVPLPVCERTLRAGRTLYDATR